MAQSKGGGSIGAEESSDGCSMGGTDLGLTGVAYTAPLLLCLQALSRRFAGSLFPETYRKLSRDKTFRLNWLM